MCSIHIHSHAACSFGLRWLPTMTSLSLRQHYPVNAKLSGWCFLQWHYCLCHGPGDGGENGGPSPLWCHETRAHMHRGWIRQIFTRAKLNVLIQRCLQTTLFLWFFCKNQLPWKGPCDFNLHLVAAQSILLDSGRQSDIDLLQGNAGLHPLNSQRPDSSGLPS